MSIEKQDVAGEPLASPEAVDSSQSKGVRQPAVAPASRPVLKVRPVGSRAPEAPKTAVRAGSLYTPDSPEAPAEGEAKDADAPQLRHEMNTMIVPPISNADPRLAYATHRAAPPEEKAKQPQPVGVAADAAGPRFSAGFILGVALIVVALLSGICLVRLGKRVGSLEQRISTLERAGSRTLAGTPHIR